MVRANLWPLLERSQARTNLAKTGLDALLESMFPKQRAFVDDDSRRKSACCGRRAGKTVSLGGWLLEGAQDSPGEMSVYIARSRANARNIMGAALEKADRTYGLGLSSGGKLIHELDGQLMVRTHNGHRIWLAGCKDRSEVDKFRGMHYRRVVIDEAQSFPDEMLRGLVKDSVGPALLDLRGELALIGSPGPIPDGLFWETCNGEGDGKRWSSHHWNVFDNVHLPHAAEELSDLDTTDATYIREWLGQWYRDPTAIIYPYDASRNAQWTALPPGDYTFCLGVDLGDDDGTAFTVVANALGSPTVYVVKSWSAGQLNTAARAAHIERIQREYKIYRTVVDTGGLGKAIARDLREIYGVSCEPAEKAHKLAAITNVRGALKSGELKLCVSDTQQIISEWSVLPWDEKRRDHHPTYVDDCSDSLLYAFRALRPDYRPQEVLPEPGTHADLVRQGELEKKRLRDRLAAEQRRATAKLMRRRRR